MEKNVERRVGLRRWVRSRRWIHNCVWPVTGFLALAWFLIRVVPKPSRAAYPCQRAVFPLASAFILWIAATLASWSLLRGTGRLMTGHGHRVATAAVAIFVFLSAGFLSLQFLSGTGPLFAGQNTPGATFSPPEGPLFPMGEGKGIHPGRVVWVHDPEATGFNGSTGYWWSPSNNNQQAVDAMLERSILLLTGEGDIVAAWDRLFRWFNLQRGGAENGYGEGELVVVKLNMNTAGSHGAMSSAINTSPQVTLALARQLVNRAGIPSGNITFYDISRYIPSSVFDPVKAEFPDVRFVDRTGENGREMYAVDSSCRVDWSEPLVLENGGGNPTFLPSCVSEADYLINLGGLKGHDLAGVTICAKNHVGSIISSSQEVPSHSSPKAAGIHPYATVHDFLKGGHWWFYERPMGTYNTLTDLMGHRDLGGKTLLFIADALYATRAQHSSVNLDQRWLSEPFGRDWTSSILVSQDGVALESVGLDLLRSEPTMEHVYGSVDNYLHEAASAGDPPSGTFYDPEGDGIPCGSLGVHEHWNDASARKYSRNLGTGQGLELVSFRMGGYLPGVPSGLTAVLQGDTLVLLGWHDGSDNETGFVVGRRIGEEGKFGEIGRPGTDRTWFSDTGPCSSGTIWYRVKAVGDAGESPWSEEVRVDLAATAAVLRSPEAALPGLSVFPNPASDLVSVDFESGIERVWLLDAGGRVVVSLAGTGAVRVDLTLRGIDPGLYILRVESGGRVTSEQLMVR